jgi:hypothetical protein
VAALAPAATAAPAPPACQYAASLGHGWTQLATPPFTVGRQASDGSLRDWENVVAAVLPGTGRNILATNGTQILKSTNAGCSWQEVFVLAGGYLGHHPPVPGPNLFSVADIQQFVVPKDADKFRTVYALIHPGSAAYSSNVVANPPVLVLKSTDDGSSWQQVTPGAALGLCGNPGAVQTSYDPAVVAAVAPSNVQVLYMACRDWSYPNNYASTAKAAAGAGGPYSQLAFFRSTDGGASWQRQGSATFATTLFPVQALSVDPTDPSKVWLATDDSDKPGAALHVAAGVPALWYSADAGLHWAKQLTGIALLSHVPNVPDTKWSGSLLGDFSVDMGTRGQLVVAQGSSGVFTSTDGGVDFKTSGSVKDSIAIHAAYGAKDDLYVVRAFGLPVGYGGFYCSQVGHSSVGLYRVRDGKISALAMPSGRWFQDWYGMQTAGTTRTTIYGYGTLGLSAAGAGCDAQRAEVSGFFAWTSPN